MLPVLLDVSIAYQVSLARLIRPLQGSLSQRQRPERQVSHVSFKNVLWDGVSWLGIRQCIADTFVLVWAPALKSPFFVGLKKSFPRLIIRTDAIQLTEFRVVLLK